MGAPKNRLVFHRNLMVWGRSRWTRRHVSPAAWRSSLPAFMLLGTLGLAGCTSGISAADDVCARNRVTMAAYADCLHNNYATLTSGFAGQGDLGRLYVAEADFDAAEVAAGRMTDAAAMRALARYRASEIAAMEQKRREEYFKQGNDLFAHAMEVAKMAQNHGSPGAKASNPPATQEASQHDPYQKLFQALQGSPNHGSSETQENASGSNH